MKAYFINPKDRSISLIDHVNTNWRDISRRLGCEWIERVNLCRGDHDAVWVDEEGLLNGRADRDGWFWLTLGTPRGRVTQQLAGNGLVLGCDEDWHDANPHIDLETLSQMVSFDRPVGVADPTPGFTVVKLDKLG